MGKGLDVYNLDSRELSELSSTDLGRLKRILKTLNFAARYGAMKPTEYQRKLLLAEQRVDLEFHNRKVQKKGQILDHYLIQVEEDGTYYYPTFKTDLKVIAVYNEPKEGVDVGVLTEDKSLKASYSEFESILSWYWEESKLEKDKVVKAFEEKTNLLVIGVDWREGEKIYITNDYEIYTQRAIERTLEED